MVKTLRCSSCGAGLIITSGQPNVKCEYCKTCTRVASDIDTGAVLNHISQLWPRVRKDDFTTAYQNIKDLLSEHKFVEASKTLNSILEKDNTQARAWFYKTLIPILDQETVLFKGHYVNVVRVSKITTRSQLRVYLKNCGLSKRKQREFLDYYRSTDFLFEQDMKYIDKAIEHASTNERRAYFIDYKSQRIKNQKRMLRRRAFMTWGLISLLFAATVGMICVFWYFYGAEILKWKK